MPQHAAELAALVAEAEAAPASEERRAQPSPDAMSHTITVEEDGRSFVLRQSDTDMSDAFAALLDWLRRAHASE